MTCKKVLLLQLEHQNCYNPLLVKSGFHEVLSLLSRPSSRRGSSRPTSGRGRGTSKATFQPPLQVRLRDKDNLHTKQLDDLSSMVYSEVALIWTPEVRPTIFEMSESNASFFETRPPLIGVPLYKGHFCLCPISEGHICISVRSQFWEI